VKPEPAQVDLFLQQLTNGIAVGSLYALIAVGYTIVYGIIQLINFAHGDIFMVGAFGGLATWTWALGGKTLALWTLPVIMLGAVVSSVVVALIVERVAYRPLRNAPRLAPLITAIGVSITLQQLVANLYPGAGSPLTFPSIDGITGSSLTIGQISISRPTLFIVAMLVICAIGVNLFIYRSRTGRAMQAVAQDPDTAKIMGIDVDRMVVIAFVLGAALAGIAGVGSVLQVSNVAYLMGFDAGLKAFTAAVLGGIGNINGAIAGGLIVGILESLATQYGPGQFNGTAWSNIYAFVVLIIVLVFRPQGLFGARVTDRA
jgi:branched-chain amino acid transport system permease protein